MSRAAKKQTDVTQVPAPQFVDFVQDTCDWLARLGRVDDVDSQIEVIGIKQRLYQIRDPRSDPDLVGRLMAECSRFRHDLEMRRKVMPIVIAHELVRKGAKIGGELRGKQQQREKKDSDDVAVVGGRGKVSSIIRELALREDSMGDYLNPKGELWPELIGRLDTLFLAPKEVSDGSGNPIRIDYSDEDGKTGKITFASFKTMIYTARKTK